MNNAIGLRLDLPGGYVDFEFENNSNLKAIASSAIEAIAWQDLEHFYVLIKYNDKVASLYKDQNEEKFVLSALEGKVTLPFGTESFKSFEETIREL